MITPETAMKMLEALSRILTASPKILNGAAAALRTQQERIDELEAALKTIADAPAWGAPDRWDVTPAEVRFLARATLTGEKP